MIGWYVDLLISNTDIGLPSNINDIVFDDVNRPWGLSEIISTGRVHSSSSSSSTEYNEILSSLYSIAEKFVGFDVNVMYPFPRTVSGNYWTSSLDWLTLLEDQIPSIKYGFPNAYEKCKTGDAYYVFIHFRSSKKILKIFQYGGSNRTFPGVINNDGNITWLGYNAYRLTLGQLFPNGGYGITFELPAILNYNDPSSLYDISKLYYIRVDCARKEAGGTSSPGAGVTALQIPDVNSRRQEFANLMEWLQGSESNPIPPDIIHNVPPDNPYEPGGESGEGGGDGNFDDESDKIEDSSLPTLSASNTGFTRIYNPTLSQVQALAQYLWTDESVIQTIWNHIKQYFEDPMQAIIGFNLVPCVVPNGGTTTFKLMYIDTGVSMTAAANQFVDVDCGTLTLEKYYGSALDYSPYTKVSCFLPYIGTVQLNTDEVMDTTLHIKYRIDICSGSCVAKILVNDNVLYQYSGHCAIPIPFAAADFSSYVSAAIAVAKLAIGGAAGGAIGALESLAKDPSQQTNQVVTTTQVTDTARNPVTGRQITMGTRTTVETRESPADQSSTMASFSGLTPSNIANTVGQIMGSKPHVEHSGSFSGNTGYLGVRRPFLIIERPNMCMPAQYQQFNGFPSMITETLSNLKGFTKVQQVQLTGMSATNPEQAEILEFLKSGVII